MHIGKDQWRISVVLATIALIIAIVVYRLGDGFNFYGYNACRMEPLDRADAKRIDWQVRSAVSPSGRYEAIVKSASEIQIRTTSLHIPLEYLEYDSYEFSFRRVAWIDDHTLAVEAPYPFDWQYDALWKWQRGHILPARW